MIKKNAPAFSYEAKRKTFTWRRKIIQCLSKSSKLATKSVQAKVKKEQCMRSYAKEDSRQKQKQTNKRSVRAKIAMHEKLRQRGLQTELSDVRTPITPHSAFSLAMHYGSIPIE